MTWDVIHALNAEHAKENSGVTKADVLELLAAQQDGRDGNSSSERRGAFAAAPVSLNGDAPLTCQFLLEDHAVRHSFHHLAAIRRLLKR